MPIISQFFCMRFLYHDSVWRFFMTVKVTSIGLKGLEGYCVQVEVKISPATESMIIIGLPDASVKESKERVLAALSYFAVDVQSKGCCKPFAGRAKEEWPAV
jgi:hypothetical protein